MSTIQSTQHIQQTLTALKQNYQAQEKTLTFEIGERTISGEVLLEEINTSDTGEFIFHIGYAEVEATREDATEPVAIDSLYGVEFLSRFFDELGAASQLSDFEVRYGSTHYLYHHGKVHPA